MRLICSRVGETSEGDPKSINSEGYATTCILPEGDPKRIGWGYLRKWLLYILLRVLQGLPRGEPCVGHVAGNEAAKREACRYGEPNRKIYK